MPADVRAALDAAKITRKANVFMIMLNSSGRVVHGFPGYGPPGRRRGPNKYLPDELDGGLKKLALPESARVLPRATLALPDVQGSERPAGVRVFVRTSAPSRGTQVVVETIELKGAERNTLSYVNASRTIDAETLRRWWIELYPAGIRTADQSKPFKRVTGSLRWTPVETDSSSRVALLRGPIRLSRGGEEDSSFEGTVRVALMYGSDAPGVRSIRGVVEGTYLYRPRGRTVEFTVRAAIESRPE